MSARAARVREEPYTDALPTERTAIMITTFMTEGRPLIPAFLIAITNGEAFASELLLPLRSWGLLYGTRTPTSVNEIK
jgi:hypothetical protein